MYLPPACLIIYTLRDTIIPLVRRPSHLYNAGTEHVEFSPTRQMLLAPSVRRREAFGESHEAGAAAY